MQDGRSYGILRNGQVVDLPDDSNELMFDFDGVEYSFHVEDAPKDRLRLDVRILKIRAHKEPDDKVLTLARRLGFYSYSLDACTLQSTENGLSDLYYENERKGHSTPCVPEGITVDMLGQTTYGDEEFDYNSVRDDEAVSMAPFSYEEPDYLIQELYDNPKPSKEALKSHYAKYFEELRDRVPEDLHDGLERIKKATEELIDRCSKQTGYISLKMSEFMTAGVIENVVRNLDTYKPVKSVKASMNYIFGPTAVMRKRDGKDR